MTAPVSSEHTAWPVLSGALPPPSDAHVARQQTGIGAAGAADLASAVKPGGTLVLVPGTDGVSQSLGGLGGTGKTELASAIAHAMWDTQAVELVLWLNPSRRDAVMTGYAQALHDIGGPDPGESQEGAAAQFLGWLAETSRPWLVVLDDLKDPETIDGLWPYGAAGRVIVTAATVPVAGRATNPDVVEVGAFSAREATTFLASALHGEPDHRIGALDLAGDLGFLPVALAQAAAVMMGSGFGCRAYRARLGEQLSRLPAPTATDPCPPAAVATWSLALEMAGQLAPAGLAGPALALLSLLDPHGVPGAVCTSQAARAYLSEGLGVAGLTEQQARAALYNLARAGLVTIDTTSSSRTVRVHPAVQAITRRGLTQAQAGAAARAAAAALVEAWPEAGAPPAFEQALRDCTGSLRGLAGRVLWTPECHPVLLRAGHSLDTAGLTTPAAAYWREMQDISRQVLGPVHAQTVLARDRLGATYVEAGRASDAVAVFEQSLADRERILGTVHPDTAATRENLSRAYLTAGRPENAVKLAERTLGEAEHALGPDHAETLAVRYALAQAYLGAGRHADAIAAFQNTLDGREHVLGGSHPDTIAARAGLATAYRAAGRSRDAISLYERVLAEREHAEGPSQPGTIAARGWLGSAYRSAGRHKEAVQQYKRALADLEATAGPTHPDTINARANLADGYHLAGKLKDAISQYQRVLEDREEAQGPDHPDTLTARGSLAAAYHSARKLRLAIPLYERVIADCERVLGAGHPNTITSRGNLAQAYHTAGRPPEAIALFERALADAERTLGPGHPLTQAARDNLTAATG